MKQNLQKIVSISIRELAQKAICDGHLYLLGREGRRFLMLRPGTLIDQGFINKHAAHNTNFEYESVINEETIQSFRDHFKELRYLQFEKDLRLKSMEILRLFEEVHVKGEHFLSFALAAYSEFCIIPQEDQIRMHETDLYLYRKSLYSAAFALIIAIGNDFYHYTILRDFYNLSFSLDLGLCEADYSYHVALACNEENRKPGMGKGWLVNEKASDSEIQVFLEHPNKTYDYLKKNKDVLAYPELAEVALYQHELSNGSGFPRGLNKALVSSWESIILLADSLVEIQEKYEFEEKVLDHVFNFQNSKLAELPIGKVYKKFCHGLLYFTKMKEAAT